MSTEENTKEIRFVTIVGMLLNILLSVAKFVAGILFSCQAMVADAVHSVSDLVTDIAVIGGVKYWTRPPDLDHPYGHGRIETIVTAFIGIMLALVGLGIGLDAIKTLFYGIPKDTSLITFAVAIVSIVSKEWLFRWSLGQARKVGSSALEANSWHHRSDAMSSIPVALTVLITLIFPKLWFVDQIGAIIVSIFILHAAWEIMKPALNELSDHGMSKDFSVEIRQVAMSVPCVMAVHAVRARHFGNQLLLDMHILIDGGKTVREGHQISHAVRDRLVNLPNHNITDVIVHVEPYQADELKKDADPNP